MHQRIEQLALDAGTTVSFAVVGAGPVLIWVPGWISHVELGWALPAERRFAEALADGRTVVRYDRPGCGLSGPAPDRDLVDLESEVLDALVEAVGAERVDLLATSMAVPLAIAWAARRPERVDRMVLYGGWAVGDRIADPKVREHVLGLVEEHWGLGSDVLTGIFAPDADASFRAQFSAYQRECAPAAAARHFLAAGYDLDVSADLANVRARTAVIHREQDRAVPIEEGRRLAGAIPGASLTVLPGRAHLPFSGDVDALVDAIREELGLPAARPRPLQTLTRRQLEVAGLVSEGLTNREIAERLVIAERSAESHVERIRERLGFRSRAQVAAWYAVTHAGAPSPDRLR